MDTRITAIGFMGSDYGSKGVYSISDGGTDVTQQCPFDKIQWHWARSYCDSSFAGMKNVVHVRMAYDDFNFENVRVNIPAEFLRYVMEVHGLTTLEGIELYVDIEPDGKRYVMYYTLRDAFYDLWPLSKVPPALNPKIESMP